MIDYACIATACHARHNNTQQQTQPASVKEEVGGRWTEVFMGPHKLQPAVQVTTGPLYHDYVPHRTLY